MRGRGRGSARWASRTSMSAGRPSVAGQIMRWCASRSFASSARPRVRASAIGSPVRHGHAHLVVALELGLGAARPHDDAAAAGELEHEHVRRRQPAFAACRGRRPARSRMPRELPGRAAAEPRHRGPDLGEALGARLGQRHLLGDEQADAAIDVVEVIEHASAARAVPRGELGEDHRTPTRRPCRARAGRPSSRAPPRSPSRTGRRCSRS